jgi:hypothetical protein
MTQAWSTYLLPFSQEVKKPPEFKCFRRWFRRIKGFIILKLLHSGSGRRITDAQPAVDKWLAANFTAESRNTPVYKRGPYQHHKGDREQLERGFNLLHTDIPYGGLRVLSRMTDIRDDTLYQERDNLTTNPLWRSRRESQPRAHKALSDKAELMPLSRIVRMQTYSSGTIGIP